MSTTPKLGHEAVLVEPHDVDQLHVGAPAGRGHAHQLTLVAAIRSRSVIDRIAASYAVTVAPAIARGTRRAAVSLLIIGSSIRIDFSLEPN
jgi:hypothetical protein